MEENREKAYISRSCYEAAMKLADWQDQLMVLEAVVRYQLYGDEPEGLSEAAASLLDSILPDLKGGK